MDEEITRLNALVLSKGKELDELASLRILKLEEALTHTKKSLLKQQQNFSSLKKDFVYNLSLFEERDKEIASLENVADSLRRQLISKDSEISDQKIQIDSQQSKLAQMKLKADGLEDQCKMKCLDYEATISSLQSKCKESVAEHAEKFDAVKGELDKQLRSTELAITTERRQLQTDFDDIICKREREHKMKIKEIINTVYSYELKAKICNKDADLARENENNMKDKCLILEKNILDLEQQLEQVKWEAKGEASSCQLQVAELKSTVETGLLECEALKKKLIETKQRTSRQFVQKSQEMAAAELQLKKQNTEMSQKIMLFGRENTMLKEKLQNVNNLFNERIASSTIELTKFQNEHTSLMSTHAATVEGHCSEVTSLNLQIETMHSLQSHLKDELREKKQELERCRRELSLALDRQQIIENSKCQLDLDWRRSYEKLDDGLKVEYQNHSNEMNQLKSEILRLKEVTSDCQKREIDLQKKNEQLTVIISQMTSDVESMAKGVPQDNSHRSSASNGEFKAEVDALMSENRQMKQKNKELLERLKEMQQFDYLHEDDDDGKLHPVKDNEDEKKPSPAVRKRLKYAAFKMAQMMQERQQLLQIGNRLRSQLQKETDKDVHSQGTQTTEQQSRHVPRSSNVLDAQASMSTAASLTDVWKLLDDSDLLLSSSRQ